MALSGFLFDLDGTLIDSNEAHVSAWYEGLLKHGYRVARDRIAVEIGKGGDQLVPDLLGQEAEARDGEALRESQKRRFLELARERGLRPFAGAEALLAAMRARGLRTALATSSGREQLEMAEIASGVRWRSLVDEVVGAADVEASKPAPDIVHVALQRLGLGAAECAMLGDTPWDAKAAHRAGVILIGLTSGGNDVAALKRAGARRVYRDTAAVNERLDEALHAASPGSAKLDRAAIDRLIGAALEAAEEGLRAGEVPIGCVLARGDGTILARGRNRYVETGDRARHAEIDAFAAAGDALDPQARDTILVSTLEPCVMCTGAAMETAVDTVLYALRAPADSGTLRVTAPESPENQMPRIVGPIRAEHSRALFERWLALPTRNRDQEPYVRQLLAST